MGLFKTEEEKLAKQQEKETKLLKKYGLEDISREYMDSVRSINSELAGTGAMEIALSLGSGSDRDIQKQQMYYLRTLIEQNWIIIRMLDKITSK